MAIPGLGGVGAATAVSLEFNTSLRVESVFCINKPVVYSLISRGQLHIELCFYLVMWE